MDVSVIIVNTNRKELTRNCLKSIYANTKDISFEVIVSDNSSTDGSVEMIKQEFPQVILLENKTNLGFGRANNQGARIAKGKYIFYLNEDTIIHNNAIKILFDWWEHSENDLHIQNIGAIGTILLDEDMCVLHSGGVFPTYRQFCVQIVRFIIIHNIKIIIKLFHLGKVFNHWMNSIRTSEEYVPGEYNGYITGADLFLRNNKYALFDENYFIYCEESDLELRLKNMGLKFFLIDGPKIQHFTRKINAPFVVAKFSDVVLNNSCIYYSKKNFHTKALLLRFLVFIDELNPFVRAMKKKIPVGVWR